MKNAILFCVLFGGGSAAFYTAVSVVADDVIGQFGHFFWH
jgi:hypothetical protein